MGTTTNMRFAGWQVKHALGLAAVVIHRSPLSATGMRAGLVWRLRAKSIAYQAPDNLPTSQSLGRLVCPRRNAILRAWACNPLGLGQRDGGGSDPAEAGLVGGNPSCPLEEIEHRQAGGKP